MKLKTLLFLFVTVLVTLSSCSSDDKDDNNIVGTWTYSIEDTQADVETSNTSFTTALKEYILINSANQGTSTIIFNADNTYTQTYHKTTEAVYNPYNPNDNNNSDASNDVVQKGTYSFKDGVLTLILDEDKDSQPAVLSGNTLTITVDTKSDYVNTKGVIDSYFIDDIFTRYASSLVGVDKNKLTISKANLIVTLKKQK